MAYGRLDVYWPNGDMSSHLLDVPSVSVGRSAGCTIVLDTETISRYHFSITREDENIYISDLDSANGTYVDGVRLASNTQREMRGGEEVQIGHLRMIFYVEDDQPTMQLDALNEDTQRFVREDLGFTVVVTEPDTGVPPGAHKAIDINITNTSTETHLYLVTIEGLPQGWGRVNRPTLRVDPDESALVVLTIKPPRRSDTKPGEYPLKIVIENDDDDGKRLEATATASILPYHAFAMGLITRRVTLYDSIRMVVQNQGSEALPIQITGTSEGDSLLFEIPQPRRVLAPGEKAEIRGSVKPRSRQWMGAEQEHTFDLLVRSQDDAGFLTATRGRFISEPVLPRWSLYAIGGMTLGVVALLLTAVVLLLQVDTTEPEIIRLSAGSNQVMGGSMVVLEWEAENAEYFNIMVNGNIVHENLPPEQTTVEIDTAGYSDMVMDIELIAVRNDQTAEAMTSVDVLVPMGVTRFDIQPSILYRNVITTITINWQVNAAIETRIEGLQSIRRAENVPVDVEPVAQPAQELVIEGYVTDNFTITLLAVDALGEELTETRTVQVLVPRCVPNVPTFELFEFPDETTRVISSYANITPETAPAFAVERTDQSGAWLRTRIEGGTSVWFREGDVMCEGFNPDSLLAEIVVPPPTPPPPTLDPATATPAPTNAPVATTTPGEGGA